MYALRAVYVYDLREGSGPKVSEMLAALPAFRHSSQT